MSLGNEGQQEGLGLGAKVDLGLNDSHTNLTLDPLEAPLKLIFSFFFKDKVSLCSPH
jgi:hypothetical protein